MTLAEQFDPRRNAITAFRLLLALTVVYGHAYELGHYGPDPLQKIFGVTFGEVALNTFFALSGFLVTQSYLNTASIGRYLLKRAARIMPAFWVCLILCAFLLAPGLLEFQNHQGFFTRGLAGNSVNYVARNAGLKIIRPSIGELFNHNPVPSIVNGSLWSLFPEALCYLGVIAFGLGRLLDSRRRSWVLGLALVALALHAWLIGAGIHLTGQLWILARYATQACFFLAGMTACLWQNRIEISRLSAVIAGGVLGLMSWFFGYGWGAPFLLTYAALGLSLYLPLGQGKQMPDWSYGVYIYHSPIFQALWWMGLRPARAEFFFLSALPLTLIMAALSWRFVEAPALSWKVRARSLTPAVS